MKVVLRGFTAVQEFLRDLPGDFKLAKSASIAALVAEFKDKAFPEAAHCIDEAGDQGAVKGKGKPGKGKGKGKGKPQPKRAAAVANPQG